MMDIEKEREAFEAWAYTQELRNFTYEDGAYLNKDMQLYQTLWKASLAPRPKVESAHFLAVTNTESFDKDRTNFEAWAFTMELSVDGTCYQDKRMYGDSDTHYAWEAWEAAIASLPAAAPAQADIAKEADIEALQADAARYRLACLYSDNADNLLAAVMNNEGNKTDIDKEFDAAMALTPGKQGGAG